MAILDETSIGKPLHKQYVVILKQISYKDIEDEEKQYEEVNRHTLTKLKQGKANIKADHLNALIRLLAIALPRHTKNIDRDIKARDFIIKNK